MRNCFICNQNNCDKLEEIVLDIPDDIKLNNILNIYYCDKCFFYFSDSGNNQDDYNNYYKQFNNYKEYIISYDKEIKCYDFLINNLNKNIKNIIDYGCGNGELSKKLDNNYNVYSYDIGMENNNITYDCLILSHVLEHIYNLDNFIVELKNKINDNGTLYIEVPNGEYYEHLNKICPLQEINIEHINFFTKYALNKLMIKHNFYAEKLVDDYFIINDMKYYVIRGLFIKKKNNLSFENYIKNGLEILNTFNYDLPNLYVYGCGQFLYKILKNINKNNIINIIDDNKSLLNKKINNIEIINFDIFIKKVNDNDNVLITSLIANDKIKSKILLINKKINIIEINI